MRRPQGPTFWYMASPYSLYHEGLEAAFVHASKYAARLIMARIPVHCPICHTHPIAAFGELDPRDPLWLEADRPFIQGPTV